MTRETCLYFASVKLQFPLQVHSEEEGLRGHPGADSSPDPGAEGFSEGHPVWLNSLVGRIFWDFLREKYWTDQVAQKIQKKLSKIKVKMWLSVFLWKKWTPGSDKCIFLCFGEYAFILHFYCLNVVLTAAILHEWANPGWSGYGHVSSSSPWHLQTHPGPQRYTTLDRFLFLSSAWIVVVHSLLCLPLNLSTVSILSVKERD